MNKMTQSRKREDGISIVEVMVAMAILAIATMFIYNFFESSISTSRELQKSTDLDAEARVAVNDFSRDFRQAISDVTLTTPIKSMGPGQITFLTPDRTATHRLRKITYSYNATNLTLNKSVHLSDAGGPPYVFSGAAPASFPVARGIRSGNIFIFMNANGAVVGTRDEVRSISITLNVDGNVSRPPALKTYVGTSELRVIPVNPS